MQTESIDQASASRDNHARVGLTYVIVTPARNEERYIEATILSVIRQTVLPLRWVIVSDGSTDRTDEIIKRYVEKYPWIEYLRIAERHERHFAGKVEAFNGGYARIRHLQFDVIGNLDADVSMEADYFSFILSKFTQDSTLGVAGTPFSEDGRQYDYRFTSINHVSGACQLFRRICFESIGGYMPIRDGGVDLVAVTTARKQGWKTRSFLEKHYVHHRAIGTGKSRQLYARFRFGKQDFYLGSHPLWEVFRAVYQMSKRPYLLGGVCLLSGYVWGCVSGEGKRVSEDFVRFRRDEQIDRLKRFCRLSNGGKFAS